MSKMNLLLGATLALCLMAFSTSAANAAGFAGGPNFTGFGHGTHAFTVGSAVTVSCSVTNSGTLNAMPVDSHGHRGTATMNFNYTPCTATIFGFPAASATVTDNCTWTLRVTSYNPGTGSATGTLTTNCNTVIAVPSLCCTITVPNQTLNVNMQNVNSSDGATSTNPVGLHIIANDNTISGTSSGCFGVPASITNASYQGVKHETGIWMVD